MPNVSDLRDALNLTRTTELKKGSWLSLSADLPAYPLYTALLQRHKRRTSFTVQFTISQDEDGEVTDDTDFVVSAGDPLSVSVTPMTKRTSLSLAKVRQATSYAEDEDELQGTDEEELAPLVAMRTSEKLNLPFLSKLEHKLVGTPPANPPKNDVFGLDYWLPANTAQTVADGLVLNGGGDPANFSGGAAGLTVADAPFWAHATLTFDNVGHAGLFDKLTEFSITMNDYVPEGTRALDSAMPSRCILVQHPVFIQWSRLQQVSNDNPGRDLGIWRNAIWFGSQPVKYLPVISYAGSRSAPVGSGLLYNLDLATFELIINKKWDGSLKMAMNEADQPDVVKMYRQMYLQLVCKNRRKNLTGYTTAADLIAIAS